MADVSDIQASFASKIAAELYPLGTNHPSTIGAPVLVYPGWPQPAHLDKDLAAGKVHISIWARGDGTNTTRFPKDWQQTGAPAATLTLTAAENTVTVGGTVSTPQVAVVNGQAYAVQDADTLESIAAALAALVPGASSAGPVVTVPTGIRQAAVAANAVVTRELRRQTDTLQLVMWAPTPELRVAAARAVDQALAEVRFLEMPDHSSARVIYRNSISSDQSGNAFIYRRDQFYSVEYATTKSSFATQITTPTVDVIPSPIEVVDVKLN